MPSNSVGKQRVKISGMGRNAEPLVHPSHDLH